MKKLALIFTLLFSTVVFSSTSFAGWTKMAVVKDGSTYYVDFERIRKHGGYVYFWLLDVRLKPSNSGVWAAKTYHQGDCKLFRHKVLSYVFDHLPTSSKTPKNPQWDYPPPNSIIEGSLEQVCRHANK